MSCIRVAISTSLTIILLSASTVFAGDSPSDIKQRIGAGNPEAGKEKSAMCQGCHGEDGNSASPDFPKLSGQYAAYIIKQIKDYQSGARKDPVMSDMAATVTENQDLLDIAAYFASQKQMKGEKPEDNAWAKIRFTDDNGCATCHGKNGKGLAPNNPIAPVIGGQHKKYLVKQLKDFKSHTRTNDPSGMMESFAGILSPAEIYKIAGYISGL